MDRYIEVGLKPDYLWVDAGWYAGSHEKGWPYVGTWEVDTNRFPGGLRPLSDYARSKGVNFLLWFEPERVHPDTWLDKEHPEWILKGGDRNLLNLGDPQAWDWLVNHFSNFIATEGVDYYRQDFNMDPLSNWRNNDAPDRMDTLLRQRPTGLRRFLSRHRLDSGGAVCLLEQYFAQSDVRL